MGVSVVRSMLWSTSGFTVRYSNDLTSRMVMVASWMCCSVTRSDAAAAAGAAAGASAVAVAVAVVPSAIVGCIDGIF